MFAPRKDYVQKPMSLGFPRRHTAADKKETRLHRYTKATSSDSFAEFSPAISSPRQFPLR